MNDAFAGARAKASWSLQRFTELQAAVQQFLEGDPWYFDHVVHPPSGQHALVFRVRTEPPDELGLLLGEVAHNARSALDNAVFALAGSAGSHRHQFPIETEASRWSSTASRYLTGIAEQRQAQVARMQPFHATDPPAHPLAILQWLSNADKHRVLHPVFAQFSTIQLFARAGSLSEATDLRIARRPRLREADTVATWVVSDPDTELDVQTTIDVGIAFGERLVKPVQIYAAVNAAMATVLALSSDLA